jgi:ATP adenylyltransferase
MNDERLWAPWRLSYIAGSRDADANTTEPAAWRDGADRSCFVCRAAATYSDQAAAYRRLLIVARGEHTVAVLNRFPYNNGHVLVCPLRHVGTLEELTADERLEGLETLSQFTQLFARLVKAEGFNIGLNLGRVAGAGVPGHLHWHLVPRWAGDHNFMPVAADTRVISQSLDELWSAIRAKLTG